MTNREQRPYMGSPLIIKIWDEWADKPTGIELVGVTLREFPCSGLNPYGGSFMPMPTMGLSRVELKGFLFYYKKAWWAQNKEQVNG